MEFFKQLNEKLESPMTKIEASLDRFFGGQLEAFERLLVKGFEYTYRETEKGVFGLFSTPEQILHAAGKTREKGYTNFDCLSPFPVHGLEYEMGYHRSKMPYIAFFMALLGLATSIFLQANVHEMVIPVTFTHAIDAMPNFNSYPINIGGKPSFSWPAMIPVCFELSVLFAGTIGTISGLLILSKMPKPSRKILHPSITDDKFCLWIPTDSANYNEDGVQSFLRELGAEEITVVK